MKIIRNILLMVIFVVVAVLGLLPVFQVSALDNGLAKTPPMGWNSWNCFAGNIDETKIKQIADIMVSSGMKDAGYIYLNLDDNWMANPARDSSGNLRCDPTRFPSGMKSLGDYIHSKGLKFGIYGDRGRMTCMNVPQSGSYGTEQRDANSFASWGVDYLKYDNCNPVGNMQTDYTNMKNALASCGRPIVFSICAWQFQTWMPVTGNLWRVSEDIIDTWNNGTSWGKGIIECIDDNANLASYAKPGAWNDPDMLEIGNRGCTTEEYRTQMSMWCIMASPLIAGNDIRNMSQTTKDILLNKEAIAVNQDPAGIQGTRISASGGLEVWCKPLGAANGTSKAVALLNRNGSTANITVNFASIGLSGSVTVRDLWAKVDRGSFSGSYTMSVPSHGTGMLKITSGTSPTPGPQSAFSQIEAESFNTQSGIQAESCTEGGQDIGYIENGDYVVYNNIDFGSGAASFQARVASATSGGNIEIRLDSITGTLVGTCTVAGTGDWQTWVTSTCSVSGVSGMHNLFLKFTGGSGYLFNMNWFKFISGSVTPAPSATTTPTSTPTPTASVTLTPVRTSSPVVTPTPSPTPETPGAIKVQFYNQGKIDPTNQLYLNFQLVNTGSSAVTLSNVKMRYWYTADGTQAQNFYCDYSPAGSSNVTGTFVKMGTAKTGADTYLEVGFTSGAGNLAAGASIQVQSRCAKSDWSNYTQSNDYSFNSSAASFVDWTKATGYVSGALQWGIEP